MRRLVYIVPVLLFVGLAVVLFRSLSAPPAGELPSVLVGKAAPSTPLPALDAQTKAFAPHDLRDGHVTVVNVFASWCAPCREEAPALQALAQMKNIALYGMVQKDTPAQARAFLSDVGNPFQRIDLDASGRASIEWGVYGVPETFVIDGKGIIRLRYAGPITPDVMSGAILPAIEAASTPS
ncbi:MAG TPA: DsbE family thiol:disulfide interchange protein [Rhizomicrobium sp.]|nr:DsbE family thiol:disulfide interchange protein [Rhizomicrobium sp.]